MNPLGESARRAGFLRRKVLRRARQFLLFVGANVRRLRLVSAESALEASAALRAKVARLEAQLKGGKK